MLLCIATITMIHSSMMIEITNSADLVNNFLLTDGHGNLQESKLYKHFTNNTVMRSQPRLEQ
jgi:hypothetical protein